MTLDDHNYRTDPFPATDANDMECNPAIAVVIATYNRRFVLERTLPTVLGQDFPSSRFEVIIVIDGSTDDTAAYLRTLAPACTIRIIEQTNRGAAAARNAGIAATNADLILLLDDDILCSPYLLARHVDAHRGHVRRIAFGTIGTSTLSQRTLAAEWTRILSIEENAWHQSRASLTNDLLADLDPNSSFARTLFTEIGGFDETYTTMLENADLGLRLHKAGAEFIFLADAPTEQIFAKTTTTMVRDNAYQYGFNLVKLTGKLPYFRPESTLAILGERGLTKRILYRTAVLTPLLDNLVAGPLWLCERLMALSPLRKLGLQFLLLRQRLNFWRGAVESAGSWQTLMRDFGQKLPVLMYHHIGPRRPGTYAELTVSPQHFEQQLQWLQRWGYTSITAEQWHQWRTGGGSLPGKPVLLTFDDAYADTADCAFPLLSQYGFCGTTFVVTDEVGGTNRWDEQIGSGTLRLMSAEVIRHWAGQGFEFGAHSLTHPSLPECTDEEAGRQITAGKAALSAIIGKEVQVFAYPYGDFDDNIVAMVAPHFALALSTEEGRNSLATPPHLMRRNMVMPDDGILDFLGYLKLGFSPRQRLVDKLAAVKRRLLRRNQ